MGEVGARGARRVGGGRGYLNTRSWHLFLPPRLHDTPLITFPGFPRTPRVRPDPGVRSWQRKRPRVGGGGVGGRKVGRQAKEEKGGGSTPPPFPSPRQREPVSGHRLPLARDQSRTTF